MSKPLDGIRILDLTTVLMGPYATQSLGDMGAEVVKVEAPGGDPVRAIGPMRNPKMGAIFLNVNRSKRSLVLDLKKPAGRDALLKLCETADVLVYNIRPQAMARLGLSYADVSAANPRIIFAGLVGYDQRGPYAARPAYDDLIQGAVGLPSLAHTAGAPAPLYAPLTVADYFAGMHAVSAILGAIIHRSSTGRGQEIVVPMFETLAQLLLAVHMQGETFDPPVGAPGYARLLVNERRPYPTRDGYICALLYNDKQCESFFKLIGREDLLEGDPRFSDITSRTRNIAELYALVAEKMSERTTAEWEALLQKADIPVMPLQTLEGLIDDPHLHQVGFFEMLEHPSEGRLRTLKPPSVWSDSQPAGSRPAPRLGEHSVDVLREAGIPTDQIAALVSAGITHDGSAPAGEKPA
jgi:crotonobetainyl-CoA:carnitine CoA-transferase CaiB-like acyl-CoA transferase